MFLFHGCAIFSYHSENINYSLLWMFLSYFLRASFSVYYFDFYLSQQTLFSDVLGSLALCFLFFNRSRQEWLKVMCIGRTCQWWPSLWGTVEVSFKGELPTVSISIGHFSWGFDFSQKIKKIQFSAGRVEIGQHFQRELRPSPCPM